MTGAKPADELQKSARALGVYLRPLYVALPRAWCPAARLEHLANLRPEPNFSCFGNHPSLES
jgi:hypothetical protein